MPIVEGSHIKISTLPLRGVTSVNVPFTLGAPTGKNGVSNSSITLPAGQYSNLAFLAVGVNGNQASQVFTVTYSDGSTSTITKSLSDWGSPQIYPDETVAAPTSYRNYDSGATLKSAVYVYAIPSP